MKAIIRPINRVGITLSIQRRNSIRVWTKSYFLIGVLVLPSYIINAWSAKAEELEAIDPLSAPVVEALPPITSVVTENSDAAPHSTSIEAHLPSESSPTESKATVQTGSEVTVQTESEATMQKITTTVTPSPPALPLTSNKTHTQTSATPLPSPSQKSIASEVQSAPLDSRIRHFKIDPSNLPTKQPTPSDPNNHQTPHKVLGDRLPLSPFEAPTRSNIPSARARLLIRNIRNISVETRTNRAFYQFPRSIRQPQRVPQAASTVWNLRKTLTSPKGKPAHGFVFISSLFGKRRNPFGRGVEFHNGVDLVGAKGIPILATARGKVVSTRRKRGYGIHVILEHANGYETLYAHLSKKLVKTNQIVRRGEIVGYLGNTGRSTGPHLHYSVYLNRKAVDPKPYLFK